MEEFCRKLLTALHFFAALILLGIAVLTIGWSTFEIILNLWSEKTEPFIPVILQSVGAIIIAAALIDVAQYMIEEEVFQEKELRNPEEARKTLTKIMVIIAIAVSIEGLVYIFKAGLKDMRLLIYPTGLILASSISIVALGIYQKLSISVEQQSLKHKILENEPQDE